MYNSPIVNINPYPKLKIFFMIVKFLRLILWLFLCNLKTRPKNYK